MELLNKSFICCISSKLNSNEYLVLLEEIKKEFGELQCVLANTDWLPPLSYQKEMDGNLKTEIIVLKEKLTIKNFVNLKKFCMFYEHLFSNENRRRFNINPGYLSVEGMYLATHKASNARKREYLMDSIWQEKQYDFDCYFRMNSNTFSEYSDISRINIFNLLIQMDIERRAKRIISINKAQSLTMCHL